MVGGEGCIVAKKGSKREIFVVMKLCCILPITQIYIWDNMTKKCMYISYQYHFPHHVCYSYIRSNQSLQLPMIYNYFPQKAKIITMIYAYCDM